MKTLATSKIDCDPEDVSDVKDRLRPIRRKV
jgi:hypothetical protein